MAPINRLGYGVAGVNILRALSKKTRLTYWPIGAPQPQTEADAKIVNHFSNLRQDFSVSSPCIKLWHANGLLPQVSKTMMCGFPIFELDNFTSEEKKHIRSMDKIFVCSSWAKDIVVNNVGIKEELVHVAPLGVNRNIFYQQQNVRKFKPGYTTFLNIGKWEIRKGHDILLDAFEEIINVDDKAILLMMNHNPFFEPNRNNGVDGNSQFQKEYKDVLGDRVIFVPPAKDQSEVAHIMNMADFGIFPSRAEGWNLELLEMMSCGKVCITTDYSAHTEFADENNSILIPVKEKELARDNKWFFEQGCWGKVKIDDVVDSLIDAVKITQDKYANMSKKAIETARRFSWDNTAKCIVDGVYNDVV
jgi:glycosyltransferase involved in cell wall biosynthesis